MDDSRIIELFYARSEDAIAELSKKYGPYCLTVAKNILNNAEECAFSVFTTNVARFPE